MTAKKPNQSYRGNTNHDWETVAATFSGETVRLRVPGGWLYRHYDEDWSVMSMVFVPVPEVVGYAI